ncbi:hypothetical protein [Tenacibaculum phage Larrie]|nr:hypothetical protein [Tenacibaculum phage Larrie]
MIYFKELTATNFLSHKHLKHTFQRRPILIQGINNTELDQESNGSGKSGIPTILEFAWTGENSRGKKPAVKDAELITYGEKQSTIELISICESREEEFRIQWEINRKGANKLSLHTKKFDSEEWVKYPFSNVNDGKKQMLDWLGITKEDFISYYIVSKSKFKSFYSNSNKDNVSLVNRFSDASIIDGVENIDTTEKEEAKESVEKKISEIDGKLNQLNESLEEEQNRDFGKELQEEKEELLKEIEEVKEDIEETEEKIKKHEKSISSLIELKPEYKVEIKALEDSMKTVDREVEEKKKVLEKASKEVTAAKKLVDEFVKTDWSLKTSSHKERLKDSRKKKKDNIQESKTIEDSLLKIRKALNSIDVTLSGSIECPKCNHEFLLDGDIEALEEKRGKLNTLKIKFDKERESKESIAKSIEEDIEEINDKLSEISEETRKENSSYNKLVENVNSLKSKVNDINSEISKLEAKPNQINRSILKKIKELQEVDEKIKYRETNIENLKKDIDFDNREIVRINKEIDLLVPQNNKGTIKSLKSNIEKEKAVKLELLEELRVAEEELQNLLQWKDRFKQFKMHLANKSLSVIEFQNNRFLEDMGSDLTIKIDGYRQLANKTLKEEISVKVVRNFERSFGSYSKGEQGRLLFASILANRYMINETHPHGGLNFLCIDELFEGVDRAGIRSIFSSAKKIEIPMLMITHILDNYAPNDTIVFEKNNGITTIKQ